MNEKDPMLSFFQFMIEDCVKELNLYLVRAQNEGILVNLELEKIVNKGISRLCQIKDITIERQKSRWGSVTVSWDEEEPNKEKTK
jgi:hypothetical protein